MGKTQAMEEEDNSGFIETIKLPHPTGAWWKPWNLVDLGSEFHYVPSQDKEPHINTKNCPCGPLHKANLRTKDGKVYPYYQHYSFDLREVDQWWFNFIHNSDTNGVEVERL